MSADDVDRPLNRISTLWSVLCDAHAGTAETMSHAQQALLQRYSAAVHRYLLGALRDRGAADDLAQEFALRLIQGKFRSADPGRGRFRDFVKGVLSNLVADYHRKRRLVSLPEAGREPAALVEPPADPERQFAECWREQLLTRTWEALAAIEAQSGRPLCTMLRCRVDHPELRSDAMADRLSAQLGRPLTAAAVRQVLHRARERFADLLLDEVAQTLQAPTAEDLAQELGELGLLQYCQPALDRYASTRGTPTERHRGAVQ